eukprot:15477352-Alexandrium_andersonii.AAC.1
MALASMLRGVRRKRGGVGLFTVIKSAELVDAKVKATVRLVFDQRFNKLGVGRAAMGWALWTLRAGGPRPQR